MRWKDGQDVLGKHALDCAWSGCPGCTEEVIQRPRSLKGLPPAGKGTFFSDVAEEQADWEEDE